MYNTQIEKTVGVKDYEDYLKMAADAVKMSKQHFEGKFYTTLDGKLVPRNEVSEQQNKNTMGIKVEIGEAKAQKGDKFPRLMNTDYGVIVLVLGADTHNGEYFSCIVLYAPKDTVFIAGDHKNFLAKSLEDYKGSITLSNE